MDLIGRDRELAELTDRLDHRRLVTVIGPGGIGKTALAHAAVGQVAARFALGAHTVDLTRVDDAGAVRGQIADELGFPSFDALVGSPSEQPALLLIDNCEHVIDAAADAIAELLDACRSPSVLATSRSPLDLPGESVLAIGPLPLPARGLADVEAAAVRLFLERVRDAGAVVAPDQLDVIATLCRALDGVPLALELAAARTRELGPAEILARLAEPETLARPRFRGASRHRSLRATTEWSYDLLAPDEQRVFDWFGVFAAPVGVATVHAMTAGPDEPVGVTASRVSALVAASLLTVDQSGPVTRYRQLEPLRAFARERLTTRGELDAAYGRFVDHSVGTAAEIVAGARRGWDDAVLRDLLAMYQNLSVALRWCVDHDRRPDRALLLLAVLWGVAHQAHADDIAAAGEQVLTRWPDPGHPLWPDAAATVATCRFLLGRPTDAIDLAERALAAGDRSAFAPCTLRRVLGQAHWAGGDVDAAREWFADAARCARERGLTPMAMELEVFHAHTVAAAGRLDEALAAVHAVHAEAVAAGSPINAMWAQASEGYLLLHCDLTAAVPVITAGLESARRAGYPACVTVGLQSLALAHLAAGDVAGATRTTAALVDDLVARGAVSELRGALHTAALVLRRAGASSWSELAATAAALPAISMFLRPGEDRFPLPASTAPPLTPRDAVLAVRTALAAVTATVDASPDGPEPRPDPDDAVFRRAGDFWDVRYAGREVRLKATKGMRDLARLLAAPERDIHCLDLADAAVDDASTGEVIDQRARREYEERLRELQAEVDAAEAAADLARAERAHLEFDTVVEHLTAALGLSGRSRRGGDTVERARQAVTQRIRTTIKRIAEQHPELGRHLDTAVTTGTYCSYRPEHPIRWSQ